MTDESVSRRRLLAALGTAGAAGLAGCTVDAFDDGADTPTPSCPPYDPVEPSTRAWRGHLGPPTNTGAVAADAVPNGELTFDWEATLPTHVGHHVPVVADGTVYAHDLDDDLAAFDAATGETLWVTDVADPVADPAVSGDTLVVTTRADVRAYETATGDLRWRHPGLEGSWSDASPTVAGDTVYLQRGIATHALALADGSRRWRVPTGLPSEATPAVTADTVYVAGDDTYVRALSPADGSERWRTKTTARVECNLTVVGDTVLAGTDAGVVRALDAATGAERWRHQLGPDASNDRDRPARPGTLATDGSRVYVATDSYLVALAMANGTPCWRDRSYGGGYASGVAVGAGNVYAPTTEDAYLSVIDAATGDRVQEISSERAAHLDIGPSLAEGGLYLAGRNAVVRFS
jgi:outer membrane protein assembly factor BamB